MPSERFRSHLNAPPASRLFPFLCLDEQHTHFGWDTTLDGIRYIQAALSYPHERESRLPTIATGDDFPHGAEPTPVLLYTTTVDESTCTSSGCFAPRHVTGWSRFYELYPRRPDLTHVVPPYVASHLKRLDGGAVGWGDHVQSARAVWELGPQSAIEAAGAATPHSSAKGRLRTAGPVASHWLRSLGSSVSTALESDAWSSIRQGASSVVSATTAAASNVATSAAHLAEKQMHMAEISRVRSKIATKKGDWGAQAWSKLREGDVEGARALFEVSLAEVEALELKISARAKMLADLDVDVKVKS